MQDYDVTLKEILLGQAKVALRELTGVEIKSWRNVERPRVRNSRVDLLGETADGRLVQIEIQISNDPTMGVRMAIYGLEILRETGKFPLQIVLYAGPEPMRMPDGIDREEMNYRYRLVDIRNLDASRLLREGSIGDNMIALLARARDPRAIVRRVLKRIARLNQTERKRAIAKLMILAGLRKLGTTVEQEASHMAQLYPFLDHEVLGREYKRGWAEGEKKGEKKGKKKGKEEGRREALTQTLVDLAIQQFGRLPVSLEARLPEMSDQDLRDTILRLPRARSVKQLLS